MPSWPVLLIIWGLVVIGSMVQATMGMGFGIAVGPLLALLDTSFVPGPTLVLGMLTAFLAVLPERHNIRWNEVGIAALGRVSGVIIAIAFLSLIPDRKTFLLAFGIMILLALAFSLSGWRMAFNKISLTAMGIVSGLMGTITSVGAPPLAIIYQNHPPAQARPTLSAFFAIGCLISIIGLTIADWFHMADLFRTIILLPGVLVGTWLGRRIIAHVDHRYRYALWAVSGIAAVQLILHGLS